MQVVNVPLSKCNLEINALKESVKALEELYLIDESIGSLIISKPVMGSSAKSISEHTVCGHIDKIHKAIDSLEKLIRY